MNKQIEDEGLTCAYLLGKSDGYQQGRADAIDEFYNRLLVNKKDINLANNPWNYIELVAREMTKQLKEQNNE